MRVRPPIWIVPSLLILCTSALPMVLAQGGRPLTEPTAEDIRQTQSLIALDARLRRVEETKPEALVEHLQALQRTVDNQQTLLWGILLALLVNFFTASPYLRRLRGSSDGDAL